MLELSGVGYRYPEASEPALTGIDLRLAPGECLGLLGPNGAGKTTLLSLISGLLRPDQGRLQWQGEPARHPALGVVPQQLAFYAGLTVGENLALFADLYRLRGAERRQRLDGVIDSTALADKLRRRAARLSGGEQRRLNFAIGLLQPAPLYLFDEATVGVDAQSRQLLLRAVEALTAAGKAVIYTSHYLDEVERVAQRILLLDHGQVRLDLDKQQLLGDQHGLLLEWPSQAPPGLRERLAELALGVEWLPHGCWIECLDGAALAAIAEFVAARPELPSLLRFGRPSLEQLYLHVCGGPL
ncbi:MAG TPA: ABC transporter ATP-binding protein [Pseudomonas sp.]|nr:ABC transporter ATP-binding protein [Pseudomonas sp.]